MKIEEELHDVRRVEAHGQEDDLRAALGMVIRRVVEMVSLHSYCFRHVHLHQVDFPRYSVGYAS